MTRSIRNAAPLALTVCLLLATPPASAAEATRQTTVSLNIPAQPLGEALSSFARQSGLSIMFYTSLGERLTSQPLSGKFSPDAALSQLLANTSLAYEFVDDKTVAIRDRAAGDDRAATGAMEPIRLAQADGARSSDVEQSATIDEVMVFGTLDKRLGVGSKAGGTLRELPKSITIMTGERIEAQNLTSLQEALIQTTGVAVSAFNPQDTFYYSRGIKLETMQFDGGAPAYSGGLGFLYTPDTATIEQIEVLRGVDGMYSGAGEPGGVINLVRKRPEHTAAMRVNLSGGTWDNYRAILDGTGPIALDGRLRGRAIASYMDRGYHLERYETEKQIAYGALEFDATDSTLLAIGLSYEKRDDTGFPGWGTPRYSDGRTLEVSREYSIAPPWTYFKSDTYDAFGRVEQKFGETGLISLKLNQIDQDTEANYVTVGGVVNPVTKLGARQGRRRFDSSATQRMADLSVSGEMQLFGRAHRYTLGTDYNQLGGNELSYTVVGNPFGVVLGNFFDYDPATFAEPATTPSSYYPRRQRTQRGYYATVGIQLAEPLRLTLGGRYSTFRYNETLRNLTAGTTSFLRYKEQEFVPSAALSYTLSPSWTTYVSDGETFNPQGNLLKGPPPGSESLSPIVGSNVELGIKGDVFDGVTAAASIYRLERAGQGTGDPAYLGVTDPATGQSCCYLQQADIVVEGMDLEMSGRVLPGWQLFGGYTFTQSDYVGRPTGANTLRRTPKHQLKAWSTYRLPGALSAVTVNVGVTAQTSTYFGSIPGNALYATDLHYGGLTLWNASVQYALNEQLTLALYSENLTDKVYWQPTGALFGQNVYGNPRSVTLSLRGRW